MQDRLKHAFELVREKFFPRWDRARHWRCRRMGTRRQDRGDGLCVPSARVIYISHRMPRQSLPQMLGVIIHEACHAVRPRSGHGRPWQDRMNRAADQAERLGEPGLAQWLREEVRRYQTPPGRLRAGPTYGEIRDFVSESGTVPSFEAMVEEFSRSRLMQPREFLKRYPNARKIYDAGVRAWERRSKGRARRGGTGSTMAPAAL